MFKVFCLFLICFFAGFSANANDCLSYKLKPKITVNTPDFTKQVISSEQPMDLLHGNVEATMITNYDIIADVISVDDGYCVALKSVDATIGYNDFLVQIDGRHGQLSCSYNAILSHENKHINTYLGVVQDYQQELHDFVSSAADSIMPIFIKDKESADDAMIKLNQELQLHPDIVLVIQKIHADEEIKNKHIDDIEDNSELKKCL